MTTYTYIHSFMTLSQRFDPNHDTCVTRLVWRRRVPWGLVVLAREYPSNRWKRNADQFAGAASVTQRLQLLRQARWPPGPSIERQHTHTYIHS